jgi:hypothetical protein
MRWVSCIAFVVVGIFGSSLSSLSDTAGAEEIVGTAAATTVNVLGGSLLDSDSDGLLDDAEAALGTDAYVPDTDGDGMPDGWEIMHGLDPLDPGDAEGDADEDGVSNWNEHVAGADPFLADTDGDGFWDRIELDRGTDPASGDSTPVKSEPADLDANGKVDAVDVQLVIAGALGMLTPVPVDANGMCGVDALDVQWVVNAALGL